MPPLSEKNSPVDFPPAEFLIEVMSDGLLIVDHNWKIVHSNSKAQQLLRRTPEDLAGCSLWDIIATDPNFSVERELKRAVQQQVIGEVDVFHPHLYKWHEMRAVPWAQGLVVTLRDITEKQWLIHREAEQTYLRNIFLDAPVALSVTRGFHHKFEFVNHEAKKLIGSRDIEGLTVREAFPEIVEQGFIEILDHVYKTGESFQAKNRPVRLDRSGTGVLEEACFNVSYQALRGFNGAVSGILSISVEVPSVES